MKLKYIPVALAAIAALTTSCSDDFLQDKKNYDNVNEEAYNYFEGANGRLSNLYATCLPDVSADPGPRNNSTGNADVQSKSTEEYCGFGDFTDPQATIGSNGNYSVPDYFQGQANSISTSAWGRIRNINDVIRGVNASSLTQSEKEQILGQAYFLRAWCYYNFVKWYGGVPIVKEVLETSESAYVPRSSTKECIEFMCEDLDKAAEMLAPFTTNGGWEKAEDYGRVTSGTALALKGRILLMWASPLFNRANDQARWEEAYRVIEASLPVLQSCGYGLAYEGDPGVNASNWAKMFIDVPNKEGVFIILHNAVSMPGPGAPDYRHYNGWEHGVRPANAGGGGGKTPSAMIVDLFPMKDGKRPSSASVYTKLDASAYTYDENYPFMDRDPRFYRTFAFPGVRWAFDGDPTSDSNHNPYKGSAYELWNYVWYSTADDRDNIESSNRYGADGLMSNAKGFYIRKRSDDLDINSPRYIFDPSNGFKQNAAPYMELRYTEVLLNLAEAAAGAGRMSVAVEQLKKIRERVGYTGDCGLQGGLEGDQAACLAAVLYERQIELAFEGKRFDDMRRWLLFDGGTQAVPGAPSTWNLSGWGGNTCSFLGFPMLNGQRRENLEFRVKDTHNGGLGANQWPSSGANPDPIADVVRPAAVDLRLDLDPQLEALRTWYGANIERNKKKGDSYDSNHTELFINFRPQFYILGFNQSTQAVNPKMEQTVGWNDYMTAGPGTFDPLTE